MIYNCKILSTRLLGADVVEKASAYNLLIDEIPFISTEPIEDNELKIKIRGLSSEKIISVFTSSNAVIAVSRNILGSIPWSVYCIKKYTRQLILKTFKGCRIVGMAINAKELAEVIIADKVKNVIFFCGDQRRDELPSALLAGDVEVEEVIVYRTILTPSAIEKEYDGILFFSPSAVESFFSINTIREDTLLFALGNSTKDSIRSFTQAKVIVAEQATKEAMIKQVIKQFRDLTGNVCNN